jgi:hypothetical protein
MSTRKFESLYCLFKGEPGTRKSTAALSFPTPIYYFDWDMKMDALEMPIQKWGIDATKVDYDLYKDWDAARNQLEKFQANCKYKTIVIDSITSMADAAIRQTLKFKGGGGKKIGTIPVGGFDEYNAEAAAISEMIALTKDIKEFHNCNVILIGHIIQKEVKSPNGQTHMARLLVTAGKGPAQKIPAYCSEIYHFNMVTSMEANSGNKYALKTTHTGDDFARSSLGLPSEIIFDNEPLYPKWIKPALDKINEVDTPTNSVTKF